MQGVVPLVLPSWGATTPQTLSMEHKESYMYLQKERVYNQQVGACDAESV